MLVNAPDKKYNSYCASIKGFDDKVFSSVLLLLSVTFFLYQLFCTCLLLLHKLPTIKRVKLVVERLDLCCSNVLKIDGSTSSSDLRHNDMKGNDITTKLWFSMYTPIVFCRLCSLCCCMTSVLPPVSQTTVR